MTWRESWQPIGVTELEGSRGAGVRRGEIGVADFPAGIYPACSNHGAMNRVSKDKSYWRCMVEGCNAGAEWIGRTRAIPVTEGGTPDHKPNDPDPREPA